ncbi:phosphodiester glycosidase family protein [Nodosilinea sp. LEGE 07088]|uniref:phosphodiester glycosidase family protein n=1 Tax=Nodosilinea sp. LEGE 07088 TaxID=2777968 RepID=UPI00187DE3D9|nr:phosphodiester glycosidase family protein [Nodosilinea sp. LEGE 07088]MBE9135978.1 phosphodiester glycosidase family protein [Nodosilinea sp. LEGE 07088]
MVSLLATALSSLHLGLGCRWRTVGWLSMGLVGAIALPVAITTEPRLLPTAVAIANAQTPDPEAQGQTVTLNGDRVAIPWSITNGQIGLADYGVTDYLGATLLSNTQPSRQPIQWFPESGAALELAAWVRDGYRFLDISPLRERYGWQVQPQGGTLQITTPPARVLAFRRDPQHGGERLTIELSGPSPVALGDNADALTLTFGATVDAAIMAAAIAAPPGPALGALTLTPEGGGTRLQASTSHRPSLVTRANPSQIIIDIRADNLQPHSIAWAPGVHWQQRYISVAGQPFPVYWLQITPGPARLRPIWPDPTTVVGTAPLSTLAQRWQATAAINAGFFNRNNQYPLGAVRANNTWLSGPILSRGVVGWNDQGQVRMERLFLKQAITTSTGQSFPIQAINSGYVQAGMGLYTNAWGRTYQPITGGETIITVRNDVIITQQTADTVGAGGVIIPEEGYLLALRSYNTAARALPPGESVALASDLLPATMAAFPNLIGGGPLLIRDRAIVLDAPLEQFSTAFATQAAPRSAIGLTADGDMLLVAAHHSPLGPGPTLAQMAQIMLQLGSTDALNLDGGSSASLYLGGRLINRSPRTAARVNNGIGLFLP